MYVRLQSVCWLRFVHLQRVKTRLLSLFCLSSGSEAEDTQLCLRLICVATLERYVSPCLSFREGSASAPHLKETVHHHKPTCTRNHTSAPHKTSSLMRASAVCSLATGQLAAHLRGNTSTFMPRLYFKIHRKSSPFSTLRLLRITRPAPLFDPAVDGIH